ncbi:MAG: phospholipase [Gemmatimonadetes bacterium]|nr:phospholipase [Gemmatimonadota bacterium]
MQSAVLRRFTPESPLGLSGRRGAEAPRHWPKSVTDVIGRSLLALVIAPVVSCGAPGPDSALTPPDTTAEVGRPGLTYDQFLPAGYSLDTTMRWPMILALHGAGGLIKEDNLIEVEAKHDPAFPFVVIAPRTSSGWHPVELDQVLVAAQARLRIDPDRIYLTGLSMGAYGAWDLAVAYPHRFAALALISGGGSPASACVLDRLPVWAFANRSDPVVACSESEMIVRAVNACGGSAALTIYDELSPGQWAHNAWQVAWTSPELYQWFLRSRRAP